jgi:predicted nucleic acid-binding protein
VIQLDTSFLIRALVSGSPEARQLSEWLSTSKTVGISAVAWAEFMCGPVSTAVIESVELIVGDPVAFSATEAALAASLFNETGRRRGTLVDCMIAATAIHAKANLATSNPADFKRLEEFGLTLA